MQKTAAVPTSLLIVDLHILFRHGLIGLFEKHPGFSLFGEAGSAAAALALVGEECPDIALVDIALGTDCGFGLTQRLCELCPQCAVVILTSDQNEDSMRAALHAGAQGYLTKDVDPQTLVTALKRIRQGEPVFPAGFLLDQLRHPGSGNLRLPTNPKTGETLTERELDVLQLLAEGLTDKEVARRLHIATDTAKNHLKHIRSKLAVANRLQATMRAISLGLVRRGR